jgi:CHAT domain-containing protein
MSRIGTVVVVPDAELRGVPLAAFMDGDQYLAQRYSLVFSPGFEPPRPDSPRWKPGLLNPDKLLGAALTKAQCSPQHPSNVDLPFAEDEVRAAARLYRSSEPMVDESFRLDGLADRYRGGAHRIVHIASHAEFRATAGQSVLYACDGTVGISNLDDLLATRPLGQRLDLLVLSGCQTASGDERAALGLGGLAVQAGATHALATLWHISDRGAAAFMKAFYTALQTGKTKAAAVQEAQIQLLKDDWLRHPFYWAAFVLIGNAY